VLFAITRTFGENTVNTVDINSIVFE